MKTKIELKVISKQEKEGLYYQALNMAFNEFIEEEKTKCVATEHRLMAKIEAARELYKRY